MSAETTARDVVRTPEEAVAAELPPLLVLEPLEAYLDAEGLGSGPIEATALGDGHSNVTYLIRRGDERVVLRRPPRPPLPPSAHDVLREARLQRAVGPAGVPVPEVLATCDDLEVIGAPFYVMPYIAGHVISSTLPDVLAAPEDRVRIGEALVDGLVAVHAVDVERPEIAGLGKPSGYLERQLRRFTGIWESIGVREVPDVVRTAEWLAANRPESGPTTIVHGDYRLGNAMFADRPGAELVAILDWEMATLGDPLADVGYLTAMWAGPDDPANPLLELSGATRRPGFADRASLAARYADVTGRGLDDLAWYQVLAEWKAAIFLENSYKRYLAGSTHDPYFGRLDVGVPALARSAWERAQRA